MKKILLFCATLLSILGMTGNMHAAGDITNDSFTIEVRDFTPGGTQFLDEDAGTASTVNNVLETVLEKLIVIFGVLAAFMMTIGAGYMIIYHGQDEFLSRGKAIFMSGIISLAIALSAGIIVRLFTYILY